MVKARHLWTNPSYLQNSVSLLLFFASWGIWWSFFQIWLTNDRTGLGLSGGEVGTIYSINSAATLVIMLFYGTIQDRQGIKRHLVTFCAAVGCFVGPFVMWVYRPLLETHFFLGAIVGAIVLSAGFISGCGLFEAVAERYSRRGGYEYGQARAWGSFGYAMVALVAGFLFTINPAINFWMGSVFALANLLVITLWKTRTLPQASDALAQSLGTAEAEVPEEPTTPSFKEMAHLFTLPMIWVFIVLVFGTWTFYTVFDQQMFPDFYTHLFKDPTQGERVYGVLNSIQVFAESVMMGVVPIIMRKVGVKRALLMGFGVMCLRILGCAVFSDPIVVSCVKMLHAIEVPLCSLPAFRYFTLHFDTRLSATIYLVAFQVSSQIGNVVLSHPLGLLRDRIGYQPTFLVISATVLVFAIYGAFTLKGDQDEVNGDPFYTDKERRLAEAETN